MLALREWLDRLLGTLRLRRGDADLEAELRTHAEHAGNGYASRVALTQTMDALRDRRGLPWLHALSSDVVFGWRQLRSRPIVTAAAILSLGLAIGATSAAFRLVDAVLLRPLPVDAPERLVYAVTSSVDAQRGLDDIDTWDYPTYRRYRALIGDRADVMVVGSSSPVEVTVTGTDAPERVNRQLYSGNVFGVFGLQPALGRLFGPADDRVPGGHPVVVLAYDYWRRRFGGQPDVLGQSLRMGRDVYQVIGVAPRGFTGTEPGRSADLFLPATMNVDALDSDGWGWLWLWLRPRPGVSLPALQQLLQADRDRVTRDELGKLAPDAPRQRIDETLSQRVQLLPAGSGASRTKKIFRRPLAVLAALAALVLLIACANVANLLNGQALARRREMALRVSIGAGRWRLVRMMLVESALLATLASVLGGLFAWWAAPFVVSQLSSSQDPVRLALDVDWRSVIVAAALTGLVALLFGLLPALRASTVRPVDAINGGGRVTSHPRITRALIGAQAAFCVFVLFVAVLFVATFARLSTWPLGFRAEGVLVVDVNAPRTPDAPARWASAAEEIRALPGVESVAVAGWPLLSGNRWRRDVRVTGKALPLDAPHFLAVSPGFFATMQIPLLEGRDVRAGEGAADVDGPASVPHDGVGIVNQAFVRAYFDGRSPLGERVSVQVRPNLRASMEIIGVVGDAAYANVRDPLRPTVYVPAGSRGDGALIIRTHGDPTALAPILRRTLARLRPDARIGLIASQTELVRNQLVRERLLATLSSFIGVVALLLSAIGLYGVLHHAVVLQQRQIGIRMALGAPAISVVRHVTAGLFAAVAVGAGIGLGGGLFFGRLLEGLLFRVSTTDTTSLVAPLAVLAVSAAVAALPPALRAVRIDPATTLRAE